SQAAAKANAGRNASKSAAALLSAPRWCRASLVFSMQELPPRLQVVDPTQLQPLRRLDRERRPHGRRARARFQEPGKLLEGAGGQRLAIVRSQRTPARSGDQDRRQSQLLLVRADAVRQKRRRRGEDLDAVEHRPGLHLLRAGPGFEGPGGLSQLGVEDL